MSGSSPFSAINVHEIFLGGTLIFEEISKLLSTVAKIIALTIYNSFNFSTF
jgi:hypothetical protein